MEPERVERVLRRSGICVDIGIWSGREEPGASRSGYLQIGTAAITTRGLGPHHCAEVAGWICDILDHPDAIKVEAFVTHRLARMCARYPVYSEPSLIPF
ncbi:Serine hydroxymethyltransferase [compost metagenome]